MATLEITTRIGCKNDCSYCPQEALVKAYKERSDSVQMSFDLFRRCLDKVPRTVQIDFSGMAEPWLNGECTEMVRYALQAGFTVVVYTTLVGMGLDDIERLKDMPFKRFEVHLPDADHLTKIKISPEYLEKLQRIATSGISGLTFMTIGRLHPAVSEVVRAKVNVHDVIDRAGNLTDFPGVTSQRRLAGMISCKSCGEELNHNVLLPNGEVILCCMDYGLRYVIGNLTAHSYEELFQSQTFRELQGKLRDDRQEILCRYCYNAARSRWNYIPGAAYVKNLFAR